MHYQARYPAARPRRLRQAEWIRRLARENALGPQNLIWALIVHDGAKNTPIPAMPGVERLSIEGVVAAAAQAKAMGVPAIALFPHIDPALKNAKGSQAYDPEGLMPRVIRAVKAAQPEVGVMVDVALDPYTDHGHDGLLDGETILNDETIERLMEQSVVQASAGADIIAPSDMMDGRIGAIRKALDKIGRENTLIMSYAAKYASAFYGPYREAIGSASALKGDKKTYQMDFANSDEALKECALDVAEGADMLLVKPGLPYLDIVRRVKDAFALPTYAFQVSGEYAMIKASAERGWIDEDRAILETLMAFRRAGADGVVTYFAPRAAELIAAGR